MGRRKYNHVVGQSVFTVDQAAMAVANSKKLHFRVTHILDQDTYEDSAGKKREKYRVVSFSWRKSSNWPTMYTQWIYRVTMNKYARKGVGSAEDLIRGYRLTHLVLTGETLNLSFSYSEKNNVKNTFKRWCDRYPEYEHLTFEDVFEDLFDRKYET